MKNVYSSQYQKTCFGQSWPSSGLTVSLKVSLDNTQGLHRCKHQYHIPHGLHLGHLDSPIDLSHLIFLPHRQDWSYHSHPERGPHITGEERHHSYPMTICYTPRRRLRRHQSDIYSFWFLILLFSPIASSHCITAIDVEISTS